MLQFLGNFFMGKEGELKKSEYGDIFLLFIRLSGWIVGPIIIAVLVGIWLDNRYETSPWLLLTTVGISFFVSMVGLVKETLKEYKNIESSLIEKKGSTKLDNKEPSEEEGK